MYTPTFWTESNFKKPDIHRLVHISGIQGKREQEWAQKMGTYKNCSYLLDSSAVRFTEP